MTPKDDGWGRVPIIDLINRSAQPLLTSTFFMYTSVAHLCRRWRTHPSLKWWCKRGMTNINEWTWTKFYQVSIYVSIRLYLRGKKCNILDFFKFGLSDLWWINVISIFVPFPLSILAALNLSSPDNWNAGAQRYQFLNDYIVLHNNFDIQIT